MNSNRKPIKRSKPEFLLIGDERIRISTIKRYKPGETILDGQKYSIQIYFSVNKMNERISFTYPTRKKRDHALDAMDHICGF